MKRYLFVSLFLGLLLAAFSAKATTPKSIVVFGDSYTDVGNLYYLIGQPAEDPWFTNGRIGDGLNWTDYLAGEYKHVPGMEPSSIGGSNYAQAGADSGFGDGVFFLGSTGQQVGEYLDEAGRISGAGNALFVFWVGTNDFLGGETDPSVPAVNVAAQASALIEAGAKHFLIVNMLPLGLTPDGLAGGGFNALEIPSDTLNSLSSAQNEALLAALREVKCMYPSAHFYPVDAHQLLLDVLADPQAYGFTNITDPALYVDGDPNVSLWWDGVHVTSRFHALLAESAVNALRHHSGGLRCDAR